MFHLPTDRSESARRFPRGQAVFSAWRWGVGCLAVLAVTPLSLSEAMSSVTPGELGVCYASTGNADGGRLLRIDTETGAGTLIADLPVDGMPALALRSDGQIFGGSTEGDLYLVDASDGSVEWIGNPLGIPFPAIVFDAVDSLYGIAIDDYLYALDPDTGHPTQIGYVTIAVSGLALDPADSTLYASDVTGNLFTLDVATGAATLVGSTGFDLLTDLVFDGDGLLCGAVNGGPAPNDWLTIDKATGVGTLVGPIGYRSVSGLGLAPLQPSSGLSDPREAPAVFGSPQVSPNPCRGEARIRFSLPRSGHARIDLFDTPGRLWGVLLDADLPAGNHEIEAGAEGLPTGVYYARLSFQGRSRSRKIILTR